MNEKVKFEGLLSTTSCIDINKFKYDTKLIF